MWRRILPWLGSLWITVFCTLPAQAQANEEANARTPALAYTIAFMFTLLVLVVVCTPSRKSRKDSCRRRARGVGLR